MGGGPGESAVLWLEQVHAGAMHFHPLQRARATSRSGSSISLEEEEDEWLAEYASAELQVAWNDLAPGWNSNISCQA